MSYVARVLGQSGISMDSVVDEMRFLTIEKIGPKQSFTPEGFLLIRDTPVARCGWQIYGPKEIPLHLYPDFAPPPDGVFRVKRDEDEVFAEETIASANGKPVVDEHPPDIVTPDTHAGVPGVMFDVRRGAGAEEDLMIADLIIYNKDLIAAIQDGKRELSCGYDVDYEELAPGKLAQKNIRINHVALVDSGRCGPRCSISDHSQTAEEKDPMATIKNAKRSSIVDAIRGVLKSSTYLAAKDREELEKALEKKIGDEIPEEVTERDEAASPNGHHIEVHTHMPATAEKDDDPPDGGMEERMSRVESAVHELAEMIKSLGGSGEAEEATSDDEVVVPAKAVEGEAILGQLELEAPVGAEAVDVRKAKDSRYLADSFQATAATAEIIVPGIHLPTFDQKMPPDKSFRVICDLRRTALDLAHQKPDTRGMIDEILAGRMLDVKKMSCDNVRGLFSAVGAMKRGANNRTLRVGDTGETRAHGQPVGKGIKNLTDYQKMLNDTYNPQKKSA